MMSDMKNILPHIFTMIVATLSKYFSLLFQVAHSLVNWDVDVDLDLLYDQSLLAEPRGS